MVSCRMSRCQVAARALTACAAIASCTVSGVGQAQTSPVYEARVKATAGRQRKPVVRFRADGRLKIVQFTDIHNGLRLDPRVETDMGRLLDQEKPDLVVLTGDNVSTDQCSTANDLNQSIRELSRPMETRRIPWAAVFGNHDADTLTKLGVTKPRMLAMYRELPHNVNPPDPRGVYGAGNGVLLVPGARGGRPALAVWLIDSNAYAPGTVAGQKLGGYDWIRLSQIAWYDATSRRIERQLGRKLPGLMFMHICLPEFTTMVTSRVLVGVRDDLECPPSINSGMFAALLDRGDVAGLYVGHDHYNSYEGNYYGLRMGYGGAIKFAARRPDPAVEARLNATRGARVFIIEERNPRAYETHYLYVRDLR